MSTFLKGEDREQCEICPLAKQIALRFSSSSSSSCTWDIFELVHCDLWGPYRTPTRNGCRYFVTVDDDFSRAIWTFLVSIKQHVSKILQNFIRSVYSQFNKILKTFRSDNGTEFTNQFISGILSDHGILHHGVVWCGVAERKHETLEHV